jgi:predicted ATPase/DNA-binding SARP family transcriptional activator
MSVGERGSGVPMLTFHDLGPVTVDRDRSRVPLAGRQLPLILSRLLVNLDEPTTLEALSDALWPDAEPEEHFGSLHSHLWRLRHLLEPERSTGHSQVLHRDNDGYRLALDTAIVDSQSFLAFATQSKAEATSGSTARALDNCASALALWRGQPLMPFTHELWATAAVGRLLEVRRQLMERHIECLLALDDPQGALVALEDALVEFPLAERLWAQRMHASHATGRPEEALATFHTARRRFLDELGVEPGQELRDIHWSLLAGTLPTSPKAGLRASPASGFTDETVSRPSRNGEVPRRTTRPTLPRRSAVLLGRHDELLEVGRALAPATLTTMTGPAGVGKTRIGVEIVHQVRDAYPDGVWYLDLAGAENAAQLLDLVTSILGFALPPDRDPLTAVIALMRERDLLLVLDNCEHLLAESIELVEPLVELGSRATVLATSREPLFIAGENVLTLGPLVTPDEDTINDHDVHLLNFPAIEMFVQRYSAAAPHVTIGQPELKLVVAICAAVGALPLAIELSAAMGNMFNLLEIAERVRDDPTNLSAAGRRQRVLHESLRGALDSSYRTLSPAESAMHRRLHVVSGPMTAEVVAALNPDLASAAFHETITGLVRRSMLVAVPNPIPGLPTRFAQLATLRAHAALASHDVVDQVSPESLRDDWVRSLVAQKPRLGHRDEVSWHACLDNDMPTVRATLQSNLQDASRPLGAYVASRLNFYWFYRGMSVEAERWLRLAIAGPAASGFERCLSLIAVAAVYERGGRTAHAASHIERLGFAHVPQSPQEAAVLADALTELGLAAWIPQDGELLSRVSEGLHGLAARYPEDGTLAFHSRLVDALGASLRADPAEIAARAADVYAEAVDRDDLVGLRIGAGQSTLAALRSGSAEGAMHWSERALFHHQELGIDEGPIALEVRGNALTMGGRAFDAIVCFSAAQAHSRRAGVTWPVLKPSLLFMERAESLLSDEETSRARHRGSTMMVQELEMET